MGIIQRIRSRLARRGHPAGPAGASEGAAPPAAPPRAPSAGEPADGTREGGGRGRSPLPRQGDDASIYPLF